ncbi:MAG: hypothetical protein LBK40_01375 [Spirochaetaceae bacterium]|jgi:hypothetical protein|nr:hypothetical protein [Spirochaetaceae bacterium]
MSFSERMNGLLGQSVKASKKIAGQAGHKAQDLGEKGFKASRDFIAKAGAKAQDLGERGVLLLEIKQLEGQAKKLMAKLGLEVYDAFTVKNARSVTPSSATLKPLLTEITSIKEALEKREAELEKRKKSK